MIRFRLFGTPELRNPKGTDLYSVLAHSKHTALLAYLLIGNLVSYRRDHLTALLWPDLDDVRARNALSKALHHLRRALGEDAFIAEGNEAVGANREKIWCDVAAFDAAVQSCDHRQAIELFQRGELLAGCTLPDAPAFEQWLESQRSRLRARAILSTNALVEEAERKGELAAATAWVRIIRELSPYDETALRRLMLLLDRTANRAIALSEYRAFAKLIASDLDAQPGLETQSLAESFRAAAGAPADSLRPAPQKSESISPEPIASTLGARDLSVAGDAIGFRPSVGISRQQPQSLMMWGAAAGVLLVAGVLGAMRSTGSHPDDNEIVVARFANQTGDQSLNPVGAMVLDRLTDGLSRSRLIHVVDPAVALEASRDVAATEATTPGAHDLVADIAAATGAAIVVSGQYGKRGDTLDFVGRATRARDGRLIGTTAPISVAISESLRGIDSLRARLFHILARETAHGLPGILDSLPRPPNYEAYREYVIGKDLVVDENWEGALPHFRHAYELDSGFVTALFWTLFAYDNTAGVDSVLAFADSLAPLRSRINPLDQYSYDMDVATGRRDPVGVVTAMKAASNLAPSYWNFDLALTYGALNRPHAALAVMKRIDPDRGPNRNSASYWIARVRMQHSAGEYSAEAETVDELSRRFPKDNLVWQYRARVFAIEGRGGELPALVDAMLASGEPRTAERVRAVFVDLKRHGMEGDAQGLLPKVLAWHRSLGPAPDERSHRWIAFILSDLGHDADAEKEFDSLYTSAHDSAQTAVYAGMLGSFAAKRGDTAAAVAFSNSISRLPDLEWGLNTYWRARIAAELGKKTEAVALLRQAFSEGFMQMDFDHSHWPNFPMLHGYEPFESLVRKDRPFVKGVPY